MGSLSPQQLKDNNVSPLPNETNQSKEPNIVAKRQRDTTIPRKLKKVKKVKTENCPICCDSFTKMVRKPIVCPYSSCNFAACKTCVMKYLREDTYEEAHCMSCRNPWSDAFVKDSCTKVFWQGPFRDHVDRLFMDKERNLLPQTQEWMAYDVFRKNMEKRQYELSRQIAQVRDEYRRKGEEACRPLHKSLQDLTTMSGILANDVAQNEVPTLILNQETLTVRRKDGQPIQGLVKELEVKEEERKNPVSALAGTQCPKESCRGFINDRGQCGTCLIFVCAKCRQLKQAYVDEDHECKDADVESVKFLRKDTKPCPSCGVPIHKIAGCSHMWCTACHTAFCWSSLKLLNPARAHNPHMVQWLIANGDRTNRGGPGPQQGGNDPVYQAIRDKMKVAPLVLKFLPQLWALHNHFQWVMDGLQAPFRNSKVLRDYRLRYLRGTLGESQWKSAALSHQKRVDRVKTKVQLMETFMLGADSLVRCNLTTKTPQDIRDEAHRLREFFNKSWMLAFKSGEVGSIKRQISEHFFWHRLDCRCGGRSQCNPCSRRNI